FYNESVNNNNVRIEQFPDVIVARMFGFKTAVLLQFSEEEKKDVDIKSMFNA
ncbi:MAG: LemA family protein, partial [Nevskiales bacterium]